MKRTDDCGIPDKYPDEGSLIALRDDRNDHERCASNRQRRIAWKDFFLSHRIPPCTVLVKFANPNPDPRLTSGATGLGFIDLSSYYFCSQPLGFL